MKRYFCTVCDAVKRARQLPESTEQEGQPLKNGFPVATCNFHDKPEDMSHKEYVRLRVRGYSPQMIRTGKFRRSA